MSEKGNLEKTVKELIKTGEHLIDLMRENYFKIYSEKQLQNLQTKFQGHYSILDKSCQKSIEDEKMKPYFDLLKNDLQIEFAGIHYLKKSHDTNATIPKRWLPILYKPPIDAFSTYKDWLQNPISGLEQHLCFFAHRLQCKEDFIITVDASFLKQPKVQQLIGLMEETDRDKLDSIIQSKIFTDIPEKIFNNIRFNKECHEKEKIKNELCIEPQKKIFSSFLLGARVKGLYKREKPLHLYFYNNPDLGGIAFISENEFSPEDLERYKLSFRRLISLVGILDGFISYWMTSVTAESLYERYKINSGQLIDSLKKTVGKYLEDAQLPKNVLEDNIFLEDDIFNPIYVVKRIGNRKSTQEGQTLIVRLGITNEDSFNFLYLDNALILNKMEEFLNGWIKGYLNSTEKVLISDEHNTQLTSDKIKVRLDIYISPTVKDIEARKCNPYRIKKFNYTELKIEDKSNFDYWNLNVLKQNDKKIPAVIYRYSELVGPSVFVGEIASAILNHYWECSEGCKNKPLKVLDLFSGTGAAEATILKNVEDNINIHFAGLDLNPYLLSDAFDPAEIPELLVKVKSHTHIIPIDIFDVISHLENDPRPRSYPNDIYSKGYDLILSDPPHFLSLDFLYQKIRWIKEVERGALEEDTELKENTLMKHLAKEAKVKCFVLYFGHKEKEWLSFFIHRVLSKEEWPDVWSILVGDERFVICFNKFDKYQGITIDSCRKEIIKNLYIIAKRYCFENRGLKIKIYDTYYREILNK